MDKRRRGRLRKLPKIDQYCSQSKKESRIVNSSPSSSQEDASVDPQVLKENCTSLKVNDLPEKSIDMYSSEESNSKLSCGDDMNNDMDDSFKDFQTPVFKRRKIQAKLSFVNRQKNKHNMKTEACVQSSLVSDSMTVDVQKVGNSSVVKMDVECISSSIESNKIEEKTHSEPASGDEAQQKNSSLCPMCWKCFDKVNITHLKACAAKHNMTTAQLMDAMALQEKQAAEREALGLPAVPNNQTSRKTTTRKTSGVNDTNDPNLQLALALSASMQEAEEQQILEEDDMLIEAGLGQEVVAKQTTLLERFGFTSSRPALLTSSNPRARGGKHKLKGFPTLLLRTEEDRNRLITEKVALILMGDENGAGVGNDPTSKEYSVKSELLQECRNEECVLWEKSSASPAKFDKSAYYVDKLLTFISPSKVEAGSKLKHLSQVPCRIKTPPKETTLIPGTIDFPKNTDRQEEKSPPVPNNPVASTSWFVQEQICHSDLVSPETRYVNGAVQQTKPSSRCRRSPSVQNEHRKSTGVNSFVENVASDWRAILNKPSLSDITIYVKNRLKIPVHELVLYVRCPAMLRDIIKGNKTGKSILWTNVSYRPALAFLEFVYCGSINKILSLSEGLEDVLLLTEKYELIDLEKYLRVLTKVRVKVASSQKTNLKFKNDRTISGSVCDIREQAEDSQSLLTLKYRSPRKSKSLELDQNLKITSTRELENELQQSVRDKGQVSLNSDQRSSSPDPFSDSQNNDIPSNTSPTTQDNINCLLELLDAPSSNRSKTNNLSPQDQKTVAENDLNKKNDKSADEITLQSSPSKKICLGNSFDSHLSERIGILNSNSPVILEKSSRNFQEKTKNLLGEDIWKNESTVDSTVHQNLNRSDSNHVRKSLLRSFNSKNIHSPERDIITYDLTQNSDDSEKPILSPKIVSQEPIKSDGICEAESPGSMKHDLTKLKERNYNASDEEFKDSDINLNGSIERLHEVQENNEAISLDNNMINLSEKLLRKNESVHTSNSSQYKIDISQKLLDESGKKCNHSPNKVERVEKLTDECKRKYCNNDSSNEEDNIESKKVCTERNSSVRKALLESFVSESEPQHQEEEQEVITFDLTQVSDGSDHKIISSPRSLSQASAITNEDDICIKISPMKSKVSTRRRVSGMFTPGSTINFTVDESVKKIQEEEVITFDLTQVSDSSDHKVISSPKSLSQATTIENDDVSSRISPKRNEVFTRGTVLDILSPGSTISPNLDKSIKSREAITNDSGSDTTKQNDNDKDTILNHSSSPNSVHKEDIDNQTLENSVDFDVNCQPDFVDYYYSPCKPYVSDHCSSPEDVVLKKGRPSLSQNDDRICDSSKKSSPYLKKALSQDSAFQEIKNDLCDIIELDNGSEDKQQNMNSLHKADNKSKTPKRNSLDACQRLLDDSFGDRLGEMSLWQNEVETEDPVSSVLVGSSTPKTPAQRGKARKSQDVTPLADYSIMDTPRLKKELHKYGIKPLKRKQAKVILRHIYNELHPLVTANSSPENTSPFKEPSPTTKIHRSPAKKSLTKQSLSPSKTSGTKSSSQMLEQKSDDSDDDTGSSISSSQSSSVSSTRSDLFAADDLQDEPGLAQKDSSELPEVVRNYILSDPELHQKVLLYEPIWLEQLHDDLKAMKYKFKIDQLMHFLDGQCITFRTAQQMKTNSRREARKKSPKKKPKTAKCSQRKGSKEKVSAKKSNPSLSSQNACIDSR